MATRHVRTHNDDALAKGKPEVSRITSHLAFPSAQTAWLLFAAATMVLVVNSVVRQPGAIEMQIASAVQSTEFAFAAPVLGLIGSLTGLYVALAACGLLLILAASLRSWGTAIAAAMLPILAVVAIAIDRIIPASLVPGFSWFERFIPSLQFPGFSGWEVAGAVLVYGLVYFVARRIQAGFIRIPLQGISIAVILLSGLSGIWSGTLMPAEALLALSTGGLTLIPILWIAQRVDTACGHIPGIRAAAVSVDESKPHTRALTSTVVFNGSTVSKIYRPGFLPRAIYWLAFQAEFPYMRNQAALRAAVDRRNLIGRLTEYWYGSNHVARAIGVDLISGRYAITSEYIEGSEPKDRDAARAFLTGLVERFEAAGLPTWQIDPRQPRATDNVIETEDGRYQVVDLESGLVAPLASIQTWRRAFQRGLVPLYDDVFFDVTRSYIQHHETAMRAELGDAWVQDLYATLDATEAKTRQWHDSEPRIWSRLLGRSRKSTDQTDRQHWATEWFHDAIAQWEEECRISPTQATKLRQKVQSPQFVAVMPHFGVHLGTGVLLRFPLGSIARAGYTATHLLHVTWKLATRRISRQEWQDSASVHSPLVILFSAIPGVGAFGYLASKPIRSDHLLLCIGLDAVMLKFPWRIYQRSGLRWLITTAPEIVERVSGATSRSIRAVPRFAWSDEHRHVGNPDRLAWSTRVAEGANVRTIF